MPNWLKNWLAPGCILAVGGIIVSLLLSQFSDVNSRLTGLDQRITAIDDKIDRQVESVNARVAETNTRIDKALEMLTAAAARDGEAQKELGYLRERVDRIFRKLDVASTAPKAAPDKAYIAFPGGTGTNDYRALQKGVGEVKPPDKSVQEWTNELKSRGKELKVYEVTPYNDGATDFSTPLSPTPQQ